ncbi:MAG: hypothetical protein KDD44_13865, partial [Bdellovibrionales bacterium]|nr:hypothetical protein [Bdellovibrionales bacterium]
MEGNDSHTTRANERRRSLDALADRVGAQHAEFLDRLLGLYEREKARDRDFTQAERSRRVSAFLSALVSSLGVADAAAVAQSRLLECEGDVWRVSVGGETFRLRDAKGLRYLNILLERQGEEIHVLDLVDAVTDDEGVARRLDESRRLLQELASFEAPGDAPPVSQLYRMQLRELLERTRVSLRQAHSYCDAERIRALEFVERRICRILTDPADSEGPDRAALPIKEKARLNVTRALKSSVQRLSERSPDLAERLRHVQTGTV